MEESLISTQNLDSHSPCAPARPGRHTSRPWLSSIRWLRFTCAANDRCVINFLNKRKKRAVGGQVGVRALATRPLPEVCRPSPGVSLRELILIMHTHTHTHTHTHMKKCRVLLSSS
ncbi:hypothetical protein E2C01_068818 [Portunus trituberculatus]|uniref:Uncharacterized protein n=1 Tax=Portunus trituberculatus TaxID=210409 RepID=A0A5B7HXQ3_PORTR|nr:hypothetical protein [Portunus trituberculatus]